MAIADVLNGDATNETRVQCNSGFLFDVHGERVCAQSGLDSNVRDVPVEIVVFQASGRTELVTRAIDETFFVDLRATLPDSIPVRTVGPDGTSTPGITYGGTTGVRQSPPRAR